MDGTENGFKFVDQKACVGHLGAVTYLTKWTFLTSLLSFGMRIPVDQHEKMIHDRML